MPKVKNIIIFVSIGVILVLAYIFFIKGKPEEPSLITSENSVVPDGNTGGAGDLGNTSVGADFLNLLLSIKSIKLNDSIFADPAFATLRDSSITLIQEGNEGRPNPFAPIGSDNNTAAPAQVPAPVPAPNGTAN